MIAFYHGFNKCCICGALDNDHLLHDGKYFCHSCVDDYDGHIYYNNNSDVYLTSDTEKK